MLGSGTSDVRKKRARMCVCLLLFVAVWVRDVCPCIWECFCVHNVCVSSLLCIYLLCVLVSYYECMCVLCVCVCVCVFVCMHMCVCLCVCLCVCVCMRRVHLCLTNCCILFNSHFSSILELQFMHCDGHCCTCKQ